MYKPQLGRQGATDSTVVLNDKEYGVETVAWSVVSDYLPWHCKVHGRQVEHPDVQKLLEFIYHNYDSDF